jgi:protein regulator of cytokinesis 1
VNPVEFLSEPANPSSNGNRTRKRFDSSPVNHTAIYISESYHGANTTMDHSASDDMASDLSSSAPTIMNDRSNNNYSVAGSLSPTPTVKQQTMTPGTMNTTLQQRSHMSAFSPIQPVLTPRETPRGTSMGLVLLSPSRTITETLNALASTTAQQLEAIWDEVGYTPQERASQLSDLLEKFRSQCEQKISEEHEVSDTFRQTIADSKEEIKAISKSLKQRVDPQFLRENNGEMTLTDELANLETTLDGLRLDYNSAKQDLQESKEYLIESHNALGRKLDDCWNDIETDLTINRREDFREKVEEMKEEMATRTAAVIQLLRDCQHLMHDLSINGQVEEASILDRRISGGLVRSKDSSFIMASKFETETCTGISAKALEALTSKASELSNEKRRRKNLLQEMGGQIAMLWEQLSIPVEEQQAFTSSVKGLGLDTIEKGSTELQRLKQIKGKMLGELIDKARENIQELWKETNGTYDQRKSFEPFNIREESMYDDKLLDEHEEYIAILQDRLEKMKPINRLIERREDILRERMEYEELQKDSDRLKQRGAAMAKQLMEEEKMARRIKKDLPRLSKMLNDKLCEWKDSHDDEFQYHGQVYIDVMDRQEEEWTEYKNNEMQLKLQKKNQDYKKHEENRYLGKPVSGGKKLRTRPLGELSRVNANTMNPTQGRNAMEKKPLRQAHPTGPAARSRTYA